ncbi:MAG: ABC transporter substrate-binding protein [Lachnospiraceae bacterium]|nr:ABC transporter substrate-binding protein [Lachnospiraceae bacterium]
MKKHFPVFFLSASLLLSSLTPISAQAANTSDLKPVTLSEVAHSIFYAPQYVAYEQGYFIDEGLDVTITTAFGADKVMAALLSDSAQIGLMGCESTIYAYNEGVTDTVLNFAQLTQRAGNFLIAREAMPDFQWEDLKGQTVLGGRKGGMPEMVFEYILKEQGIDPVNDLTIDQSIDFGSTGAAFTGGLGDFTVEFEPSATALEKEGVGYVVASLGIDSGYVPYTSYCCKSSYLDAHSDVVQKFTNALQKGVDYVLTHTPEETASVIAPQFSESDLETITTIVNRYLIQDTWKPSLIFDPDHFSTLQDILESAGELTSRVPYDALIVTDYADQAS